MSKLKILLLGGRGLLGSATLKHISDAYDIYTCDRRPGGKKHLVGDVTDEAFCKAHLKAFEVIINFVGLSPLRRPSETSYREVHVWGVRNILFFMKSDARFIHISAFGSENPGESEYLASKKRAEELILSSNCSYAIIRPNLILSESSELISSLRKYKFLRLFPDIPTRVRPVMLDSVASLVASYIPNKKKVIVNVDGHRELTMGSLMSDYLASINYAPLMIPFVVVWPFFILACYLRLFGLSLEQLILLSSNPQAKDSKSEYIFRNGFDEFLKEVTDYK